jgi:diketogulonate reductase-like aldo/keto reductase
MSAVYLPHMSEIPFIELNTGDEVPIIGLGTWNLEGEAEKAVLTAFEAGYRHIDTAKIYGTEKEIARAIHKSNLPREEIFITTKVWNSDQGYERTLEAIENSLSKLDLEYVDLYLIHWPNEELSVREETWKAMEDIYNAGKAKAIGVSNYALHHLREMDSYAEIMPAMNQIEVHPFWYRKDLVDYCHAHDIAVTNYSPLTRKEHLTDPAIVSIAAHHKKTAAQVLLRWGIQLGNIVIPKAAEASHIRENIDIFDFELTKKEMTALSELNQNESVV